MSAIAKFQNNNTLPFLIPPIYHQVDTLFKNDLNPCPTSCLDIHQLVYNCFTKSIVDTVISDCPAKINAAKSEFKLTPIHLATISDNDAAIKALLKKGAAINSKDHKQFTPIQHAAMKGNLVLVDYFKEHKANTKHVNNNGATYENYLRFNKIINEVNRKNSVTGNTCTDLSEKPNECLGAGVQQVDEMVITPQQLVNLWQQPFVKGSNQDDFSKLALSKMDKYLKNPPSLEMQTILFDDRQQHLSVKTCGVIAKSPIKKGEIITEYIGEWVDGQPIDRTYYFDNVDGKKFRHMGAMTNDAFPNSVAVPVSNNRGLDRIFFIAVEDIKPGDQITWDYGIGHHIKFGNHVEMRTDAMLNFFRQNWPGPNWVKNNQLTVNTVEEFTKWVYLFNTPTGFLTLIERGIATRAKIAHLKELIKNSQFITVPDAVLIAGLFEEVAKAHEIMNKFDKKHGQTFFSIIRDTWPHMTEETERVRSYYSLFAKLYKACFDIRKVDFNKNNPSLALENFKSTLNSPFDSQEVSIAYISSKQYAWA